MNIFKAPRAFSITLVTVATLFISASSASAALTFSPTAVTISPGQNQTVTIAGGGNDYFASQSSNPNAIQLQITNNSAVFSTTATENTTASVTICSATDTNNCGTINVTVNTSGTNNNNNNTNNNTNSNNINVNGPKLNQYSLTMAPNTSQTLTISGNGTYFISNNSNYAAVSPSINGNSLILASSETGNSTVTICQSGGCNNLEVTVSGSSSNTTTNNSGGINFNQTNPTVAPGSTQTITVSGGTGTYNLSTNSNPTALVATMSNNTISMTGVAPGTAILTICDSGNSCANVTVVVSTTNTTSNTNTQTQITNTNTATTNTASIPQNYAQTLLTQIIAMESQLTQFQNQLALLKSSIQTLISGNFSSYTPTTNTNASANFNNLGHVFTLALDIGDEGPEVTALQNRLTADGYYSGPVTGYYGSLTEAAVKRFQAANGITAQGNVGPATRAALNN